MYHLTSTIDSFSGLPTIQFLIACSMQKQRRKAWSIFHMNDVNVVDRRGVPDQKNKLEAFFFVVSVLSTKFDCLLSAKCTTSGSKRRMHA